MSLFPMKPGRGGKSVYLWTFPFFGHQPEYRKLLHSQVFDLIFHGNGGFTWSDVYNMPVWMRTFYITKIIEFKNAEKKAHDKEAARIKSQTRRR